MKNPTNVLHQYESYTSVFTLSALTKLEINDPRLIKKGTPIKNIIARSSGVSSDTVQNFGTTKTEGIGDTGDEPISREVFSTTSSKNKETTAPLPATMSEFLDVYIDNVEIDSVPSLSERAKSTSATAIRFEVFEPYAVDFIPRLAQAAWSLGTDNWQEHPFMLTIQWKANRSVNAGGNNYVVEERRIPINITQIDTTVNQGGAKYVVFAVPFPETSLFNRSNYVGAEGEIFGNTVQDITLELERLLNIKAVKDSLTFVPKTDQQAPSGPDTIQNHPDTYKIIIADLNGEGVANDIATSKMNLPKSAATSTETSNTNKNTSVNPKKNVNTKSAFRVTTGMSVTQILEDIMLLSDYCKNIFKPSTIEKISNAKEVNWFKIKSYTKLKDNNKLNGTIQKEHIFVIHPYSVHVSQLLTTLPAKLSAEIFSYIKENYARAYDYIYTGLNQDILSFDITLNNLFTRNFNPKGDYTAGDLSIIENNIQLFEALKKATKSTGATNQKGNMLPGRKTRMLIGETSMNASSLSGENQAVYDFYSWLVNPASDLVNVNLGIIGDPYYISENYNYVDDYTQIREGSKDEKRKSGTVMFSDGGAVYVLLRFRYPNDRLGPNNKVEHRTTNAIFNGLYFVKGVKSSFNSGRFTQNLELVKMRGEPMPNVEVDNPIGTTALTSLVGNFDQSGIFNEEITKLGKTFAEIQSKVFANTGIGNNLADVINTGQSVYNDIRSVAVTNVDDAVDALATKAKKVATDVVTDAIKKETDKVIQDIKKA